MSLDHSKLARVCMMLSSPNDGERASAALLASQMLAKSGQTWEDLIARASRITPAPRKQARRFEPANARCHSQRYGWEAGDLIGEISRKGQYVNGNHQRFVEMLKQRGTHGPLTLSDGQWDMLKAIADAAGVELAAA